MDKYMWGKSQAAVNLITALKTPEYEMFARIVRRRVSTQIRGLEAMMTITEPHFRRAALEMWHKQFPAKLPELPEVIRTHILCVETSKFRELLKKLRLKVKGGNEHEKVA